MKTREEIQNELNERLDLRRMLLKRGGGDHEFNYLDVVTECINALEWVLS